MGTFRRGDSRFLVCPDYLQSSGEKGSVFIADNFKALDNKDKEKKSEDVAFEEQRQASIKEALKGKEGGAKFSTGGTKQVRTVPVSQVCVPGLVRVGQDRGVLRNWT